MSSWHKHSLKIKLIVMCTYHTYPQNSFWLWKHTPTCIKSNQTQIILGKVPPGFLSWIYCVSFHMPLENFKSSPLLTKELYEEKAISLYLPCCYFLLEAKWEALTNQCTQAQEPLKVCWGFCFFTSAIKQRLVLWIMTDEVGFNEHCAKRPLLNKGRESSKGL